MNMKELCSKFLSLLRYVTYIIDEKPKIQRFLSCLPVVFRDRIEYDNPTTLEEVMRKAHLCYDLNRNKRDNVPNWKFKRENNFDQKKNFKFNRNSGNNFRHYPKNNYQGTNSKGNTQQSYTNKNKDIPNTYNKNIVQREPLKCWECGEPHYLKDCPHKKKSYNNVHTV